MTGAVTKRSLSSADVVRWGVRPMHGLASSALADTWLRCVCDVALDRSQRQAPADADDFEHVAALAGVEAPDPTARAALFALARSPRGAA